MTITWNDDEYLRLECEADGKRCQSCGTVGDHDCPSDVDHGETDMADEPITCPYCGETGDAKWFEEHEHDYRSWSFLKETTQ